MTYVANSTVTVDGKSYRPGDAIEIHDHLSAKELLKTGYIVASPDEVLTVETASDTNSGHFMKAELEAMTKAQLQAVAEDMGLDTKDLTSKARLVEAIAAVDILPEA